MVSKSFGYIAIIAMGSIALFIVLMDVLKYYFGIDVTRKKLKQNSRGKQKKTRKAAPIVLRYIYVNAPISQAPENLISTIE
jgi:Na+/H+-dicarboxylate symporter